MVKMSPSPFALLTHDLIFLPTPWAAEVQPYRTLFRKLHADADFCLTAFGEHFQPIIWTDEEMRTFFLSRDAALRWGVRGMGDFALGVLPADESGKTAFHTTPGPLLKNTQEEVRVVTGDGFEELSGLFIQVQWAGYTCVRDTTTAGGSITELYSGNSDTELPPWQEMIEVRYGMDPEFRGKGTATRAADIVMDWAVEEHGARRFIAETEGGNARSQKLLGRLGFQQSDTKYFGDEGAIEWIKVVS